jgi:TonB family protein
MTPGEIDGESLRAYAISVAVGVRRLFGEKPIDIPRAGRVTLRVSLSPVGRQVVVSVSSGQAQIDDEARALVVRALAATPVPEGLRGHAISFEVPVFFGGG